MRLLFLVITFAVLFSVESGATVFELSSAQQDIIGQHFKVRVKLGDTIKDLSKRYRIGYDELIEANPDINPQHLTAGQQLLIPNAYILPEYRKGLVINTAEARLFYFPKDGKKVYTYPVGLGRENWRTPITKTKIKNKKKRPNWYPTKNIRENVLAATGKVLPKVVPPGPSNPLGPAAIYLGIPTYLIHGTDRAESIGKYTGAGCVRMYNEDIQELYKLVSLNDEVRIIHHPYKLGLKKNILYLESHKPVSMNKPESDFNKTNIEKVIEDYIDDDRIKYHSRKVNSAINAHIGIPVPVGEKKQND